jgi:glycosyltransferase involved in cell wall biosynthesis
VRVLYVIDSLAAGGAERSLAALAPRYRERGVDLEVAYLHDRPGIQDDLRAAGARLHSLAGAGGRPGWAVRARALIRRRDPDLVHTTLFEADVAGRTAGWLTGRPVVSSLVTVAYGPNQAEQAGVRSWKLEGARRLDSTTARVVSRFHSVAGHVARTMGPRLRIPPDRIEVIPRGRDSERLGRRTPERRAVVRAALGVGESEPMVLAAARQEPQKGLDVLLEAFPTVLAEVPEGCLLVAGREGNGTDALRAAVDRLGLRPSVRFLGGREDVADLMAACDVFVLPTRWEGLPGVILEAMALEAPIVASDIDAVREAVGDGGRAVLVPVDDPVRLAEAVVETLRHPAEAAARARSARARFEDLFTIDRVADRMVGFYERALAGR